MRSTTPNTATRRTRRRILPYSTTWTSILILCLAILVVYCIHGTSPITFASGADDADSTTTTTTTKITKTDETTHAGNDKKDNEDDYYEEEFEETSLTLNVIDLTSRNFDSMVADGNVWLIEFYTPWCRHCKDFATSYASIAASFHSSPNEGIRVGKINCSVERALTARFGIEGFPSFYLVDGWSVYPFEDTRSVSNLMNFARGGYKKEMSLPFLLSPMGPLGMLQAALIYGGAKLMDLFDWLKAAYGISPIFAGIFLCGMCVFGGLVSIVLFTILTTPSGTHHEEKQD